MPEPAEFPATLEIDYPDRELDRVTTFFRPLLVIPIAIILGLLTGSAARHEGSATYWCGSGGILFVATALMLVFRRKYPGWWFDWNFELVNFSTRVLAYLALLRDEYPSTDDEQAVHLALAYPDAERELNRWLPLVKWFLAIPHYIVLWFLSLAAALCVIVAWFAILFTGRYPRGLFEFVVGVLRWWLRVVAYAFLLTTDRYPPFSLER
ncbi:MAG TPA: DUF4389 domain-containing protein [Gemmatimonadales bacterium]|nr:DUF4389 domain-containing protein [Gemmatimonadales bacterium]